MSKNTLNIEVCVSIHFMLPYLSFVHFDLIHVLSPAPLPLIILPLFLCHLYMVMCQSRQVVCFSGLLTAMTKSSFILPLSFLCPCLAELVMEPIDWLAVGPIDPQGRTAGYWQMIPQCLPTLRHVLPPLLLPLLHFLTSLFSISTLLHLIAPLPHSFAHPCMYPSFPSIFSSASVAAIIHWCSRDRCWG